MNARQTRWLEVLCEFYFDIKHIKGKENKFVDALSRRFHAMDASTISMCKLYLKTRILEADISNEHYLQVKQELL